MQQATRRLMFVLGGTVLAAGGMLVAACSTDNGSTSSGALPTPDAARPDTGNPSSSGGNDGSTDGGTDPDCASAPFIPDTTKNDGGVFCPFQAAGKGAPDCTAVQECCSPGAEGPSGSLVFPPAFCANITKELAANNETTLRFAACKSQVPDAAAPGGGWNDSNAFNAAFECEDKTSCPGSLPVCCATSQPNADAGSKVNIGPSTSKTIPAACNAKSFYKSGGTRCATACTTTEIQVCSKNDNSCPTGTVCKAAGGGGRSLGYCAVP